MKFSKRLIVSLLLLNPALYSQSSGLVARGAAPKKFEIIEATIADIHDAIKSKQVTSTALVQKYLTRIKAYNGVCVNQPDGILGAVTPIVHAGQLNALLT